MGHLVSDPVTRQTNTGKTICNLRVCISDNNAKNKCFIDVEAWEKTGEACSKFLTKGREIMLEGELCVSTWQGNDGTSKTKNYIRANKVKFIGGGKNSGDRNTAESAQASSNSVEEELDEDIPF